LVVVLKEEKPKTQFAFARVIVSVLLSSLVFLCTLSICAYRAESDLVSPKVQNLKESIPGSVAFARLKPDLEEMCAACFLEASTRDPGSKTSVVLDVQLTSDEEGSDLVFQKASDASAVLMGCIRRFRSFTFTNFQNQESTFTFQAAYLRAARSEQNQEAQIEIKLLKSGGKDPGPPEETLLKIR